MTSQGRRAFQGAGEPVLRMRLLVGLPVLDCAVAVGPGGCPLVRSATLQSLRVDIRPASTVTVPATAGAVACGMTSAKDPRGARAGAPRVVPGRAGAPHGRVAGLVVETSQRQAVVSPPGS